MMHEPSPGVMTTALADWSPKLTMSCTPMHIHSVAYNWEVPPNPWVDHGTVMITIM